MDAAIIIVLWGIILYQAIEKYLDRKERTKREGELINRIMAKTYSEYAAYEQKKEDIKSNRQENEPERGIPVY